jgi:geranylgeranyl diphosphate synthase type I
MGLVEDMLNGIEMALQNHVNCVQNKPEMAGLHEMMAYHLGWIGEGAGAEARGKRIRPLIVSLCHAACEGDWKNSLPAATAVELIHNFSLIHDDIEDNSNLRRGRPTVWKIWGIPQAINTGDALFTLAHLALWDIKKNTDSQTALECTKVLQEDCLSLTQGQYLDIAYEKRIDLSIDSYWQMVGGKTAALLASCCELGALTAQATDLRRRYFRDFGWNLGLAFQALDDILGIWGELSKTGKSAESDLVTGKKSLPILYGISQKKTFYERWPEGKVEAFELETAAQVLISEGAREYTQTLADMYTEKALFALDTAKPSGEAGKALYDLARMLLQRQN